MPSSFWMGCGGRDGGEGYCSAACHHLFLHGICLTCQQEAAEASDCGIVFLGKQFTGRDVVGKISLETTLSFLSWTPFIPLLCLLLEQKGKPVMFEALHCAVWVGCFPAGVLTSACSSLRKSSSVTELGSKVPAPLRKPQLTSCCGAGPGKRRQLWSVNSQRQAWMLPPTVPCHSLGKNRKCFFLGAYILYVWV